MSVSGLSGLPGLHHPASHDLPNLSRQCALCLAELWTDCVDAALPPRLIRSSAEIDRVQAVRAAPTRLLLAPL